MAIKATMNCHWHYGRDPRLISAHCTFEQRINNFIKGEFDTVVELTTYAIRTLHVYSRNLSSGTVGTSGMIMVEYVTRKFSTGSGIGVSCSTTTGVTLDIYKQIFPCVIEVNE